MKKIKWIILLLILVNFLPETCRARQTEEIRTIADNGAEQLATSSDTLLPSFISILFINVSEFSKENSHISVDKKAYIRLFNHLRYSKMYLPEYAGNLTAYHKTHLIVPDPASYYVYSLHRIII